MGTALGPQPSSLNHLRARGRFQVHLALQCCRWHRYDHDTHGQQKQHAHRNPMGPGPKRRQQQPFELKPQDEIHSPTALCKPIFTLCFAPPSWPPPTKKQVRSLLLNLNTVGCCLVFPCPYIILYMPAADTEPDAETPCAGHPLSLKLDTPVLLTQQRPRRRKRRWAERRAR